MKLNCIVSHLVGRIGIYIPGSMTIAMVFLFYMPELSLSLQYDRIAILSGQVWRLFTGNFTHWTFSHFVWDVLGFTLLGYLCWEKSRKVFFGITLIGPLFVSLSIWLFYVDFYYYRGVSGIVSGFVAALAVFYLRDASRMTNFLGMGIVVAVLGKLMIELSSGRSVLAMHGELPAIIMVHVSGATIGLLVTVIYFIRKGPTDKRKDRDEL